MKKSSFAIFGIQFVIVLIVLVYAFVQKGIAHENLEAAIHQEKLTKYNAEKVVELTARIEELEIEVANCGKK